MRRLPRAPRLQAKKSCKLVHEIAGSGPDGKVIDAADEMVMAAESVRFQGVLLFHFMNKNLDAKQLRLKIQAEIKVVKLVAPDFNKLLPEELQRRVKDALALKPAYAAA